jgi:hypothetical protein
LPEGDPSRAITTARTCSSTISGAKPLTGLVYVEGIASASFESAPFPTLHAWLIDPRGRVVDPTWRESEHCTYFGIPFHSEYVLKTIRTCGPCPMIDNRINRWELVRNPDVAARAILDWIPPIARASLKS